MFFLFVQFFYLDKCVLTSIKNDATLEEGGLYHLYSL